MKIINEIIKYEYRVAITIDHRILISIITSTLDLLNQHALIIIIDTLLKHHFRISTI